MLPHVAELGVQPIARLFTQEAPNDYPRLPIREHDRTFVWFAQWVNVRDEAAFVAAFSSLSGWRDSAPDAVLPALMRKPERLRCYRQPARPSDERGGARRRSGSAASIVSR